MPKGFNGKILCVNLTDGTTSQKDIDEHAYRTHLGGGLAVEEVFKGVPVGADPLGPDNTLAFFVGPMTGAPISGQSRVIAAAKSPLSGGIGVSEGGGYWPVQFKATGYDGIVISGAAPKPVYLWIDNGEVSIRDASHLWGKTTAETETAIHDELGDKRIEVLEIGPAGERQVRFACILSRSSRANGRFGLGAVMGSKNLKAIAVRGNHKLEIDNREAVSELAKWGANRAKNEIPWFTDLGTSSGVEVLNSIGSLPTRNWSSGNFDKASAISAGAMKEKILVGIETCQACVIRCKRQVASEGPVKVDVAYGGPEYETIGALGSACGVDDIVYVAKANELCNKYGLDTISAGGSVAFAIECYEQGIISRADTNGLELRFGDGEAVCALLELIAHREGLGDTLAEGSDRAAKIIGKGSERYSAAVKNITLPCHLPEAKRSLGLLYAVHPTGADHNGGGHDDTYMAGRASWYPEDSLDLHTRQTDLQSMNTEKVQFTLYKQLYASALDGLGVCAFVWGGVGWSLYQPNQLVEALQAITGWNTSMWEIMKAGERRLNLMRAFNAREGFGRKEDWLPIRCFEPKKGGATDGVAVDPENLSIVIDEYYAMAGWDANGVPTRGKLLELGLGWVSDSIPS